MIALIAFVLFGVLQVSQLLAARDVLNHTAARAARAKTVGFNHWMVSKVVDVASIPNAGRMITPYFENEQDALRAVLANEKPGTIWDYALRTVPTSRQAAIERGRIPEYLGAENQGRARFILDYEHWDDLSFWAHDTTAEGDGTGTANELHVQVRQDDYPLWAPMHRAFYAEDAIDLTADAHLESHYPLYLDDQNW